MTKLKKYKYHVFFDSSAIFGLPIPTQLLELVEKYASDDRVELSIFIPEVVNKEIERRAFDVAVESHGKAVEHGTKLKKLMPELDFNIPESIDRETVTLAKDAALQSIAAEVVSTPIDKIDWNDVIHRATNYIAPFEKQREKGFKDMMIAQTAIQHFKSSGRTLRYVFISNDKRLNDYVKEQLQGGSRMIVFESIPEFESHIVLRMDESTTKIAKELMHAARDEFFKKDDTDCLYTRLHLREKIEKIIRELIHDAQITNMPDGTSVHSGIAFQSIKITNPVLVERLSKLNFKWSTSMVVKAVAVVTSKEGTKIGTLQISAELKALWLATFTKRGVAVSRKAQLEELSIETSELEYEGDAASQHDGEGEKSGSVRLTTEGQPAIPIGLEAALMSNMTAQRKMLNEYKNINWFNVSQQTNEAIKQARSAVKELAASPTIKEIQQNNSALRKLLLNYSLPQVENKDEDDK